MKTKLPDFEVFNGPFHEFPVPQDFRDLDLTALSEQAADRMAGTIRVTPVLEMSGKRLGSQGASMLVKDESQQLSHTFKARNAHGAVDEAYSEGHTEYELASAGSFLVATAAVVEKRPDCAMEGVTPVGLQDSLRDYVRNKGAQLIEHGPDFAAAYEFAEERARQYGRKLLEAFAGNGALAGAGTLGLELAEDVPDMDVLVVPIGGGSVSTAAGTVAKAKLPGLQVVGVQVRSCTSHIDSLRNGRYSRADDMDIRFRGLAVSEPHPRILGLASRVFDRAVIVDKRQAYAAIDGFREETGGLLQDESGPAIAAANYLAGLPEYAGAKIATVATGGNARPGTARYAAAIARRLENERLYGGSRVISAA